MHFLYCTPAPHEVLAEATAPGRAHQAPKPVFVLDGSRCRMIACWINKMEAAPVPIEVWGLRVRS